MALDKNDLNEIRKIVEHSAKETKNEIIAVLSHEITDLAEINREVIKRVDKISELENRIVRIEAKLGLNPL